MLTNNILMTHLNVCLGFCWKGQYNKTRNAVVKKEVTCNINFIF